MTFLALDPASAKTGWCLATVDGNEFKYIRSGVVTARGNRHDKLTQMQVNANNLWELYTPDALAYEEPFIGRRNPAGVVTQLLVVGTILASFTHMPLFAYSNATVKKSIGGHGHARKNWLALILRDAYGIPTDGMTNDETDAIAVAVCHYKHEWAPNQLELL